MSSISDEEARALRDATRRLLRSSTPQSASEHEHASAAPPDRAAWQTMAERLGLQGVRVPEELGGTGLGLDAELIVHEEMGRALHGGPFLPVVAQTVPALLTLAPDGRASALLGDIAAGTAIVVPAYAGCWEPDAPRPTLTDGAAGATVSGVVPAVLAGADADGWLVPADAADGSVLTWVAGGAAGATASRLPTIDLTRGAAEVRLDAADAIVLARGADADRAIAALQVGAGLGLAAECVGVAAQALEMAVEYVQVREQFGQIIGAFQGIKHQVADLHVLLESARSALSFAVRSIEAEPPLRDAALAVARRKCGTAAFRIATENIHLHGGIGFTWEHRAHLYYRRAKAAEVLLDPGGRAARSLAVNVAALYGERR